MDEFSRPFFLLAGAGAPPSPAALEAALRRMGLQPETQAGGDGALRLHLGSLRMLVERTPAGVLDRADPGDGANSLIGASPSPAWRANCWIFRIEPANAEAGDWARLSRCFTMMVLLIDLFGADHLFWSPARLWSDARAFREALTEMRASGMPPVLHLVAFRRRDASDGELVATRGLAAFAGQELEAPVPPGWGMAAMVRRLARLALDLMLNGPIVRAQEVPGLESGEWVAMTPQAGEDGAPDRVRVVFRPGG